MNLHPEFKQLAFLPWHTFLVALLPFLHFHEKNYRILGIWDGLGLLLLYWAVVAVLLGLGRLAWGSWARAGLVATPLVAVLAEGWSLTLAGSVGAVILAVVLGVVMIRGGGELGRLSLPLNLVLLVLVAFPLTGLLSGRFSEPGARATDRFRKDPEVSAAPGAAVPPDVYFILVDGLGQPGFLQQSYGLPSRLLTRGLRKQGFRILENSRANYPQTALSVASTFNMQPIPQLLDIREKKDRDRRPLAELVAGNRVQRAFADLGYRTVTFPSGYPLTRFDDPDQRREPAFKPSFAGFYILRRGFLPLIQPLLGLGPAELSFDLRRDRLNYIFDSLGGARSGTPNATPVFVFAHVLAPHPPFVFNARGEPVPSHARFTYGDGNDWHRVHDPADISYRRAWTGQTLHVMRRLEQAVAEILARSPRPPVIIIQGDHGPGSQTNWDSVGGTNHDERFGIFNAWYVPDGLGIPLQDDQTAINTFPLLFNALFQADLPLQEDRHWFARMREPYNFFEVKD